MKSLNQTKVRVSSRDEEGKTFFSIKSETAFNKAVTKANNDGGEAPTASAMGTFGYKEAQSIDDMIELCGGSNEIAIALFNDGAILRQHNEVSDLLSASDYQPQEGVVDVSYAVAQPSEGRQRLDPIAKAAKILGIDIEALRAQLAKS